MSTETGDSGLVRIGELSRRVGVSDDLLRAWERRYGLLAPVRSTGGYRLYSPTDERRIRLMQRLLETGLSAAEAARVARQREPGTDQDAARRPATGSAELGRRRQHLLGAILAMDEPEAQRVLDAVFLALTVETSLREILMPCLRDIGIGWERGEVSVAQEHFASQIVRGRLLSLARGWGQGDGPRTLLACPPGEQHDLALLTFGVVVGRRGWVVHYLGADTPIGSVVEALPAARPDVVVLSAVDPARFTAVREELAALAHRQPLMLAGPAADAALAAEVGATLLTEDPISAAEALPTPRARR